MQTQSKWMRRKILAKALLLASPFVAFVPIAFADGPEAKGKPKQVPSYIAAQFDKPKIRSVHTNKANVRSGPSDKYYATSTLPNGATVDVYMETSDGWSGIRPPVGSHDWIPANIAYLLPGGKSAEIIEDKSPAWVGSESSDVSEFMWQMELRKSQQVQVLGEELQLTDEGKKQLWYLHRPTPGRVPLDQNFAAFRLAANNDQRSRRSIGELRRGYHASNIESKQAPPTRQSRLVGRTGSVRSSGQTDQT